MVTLFTILVTLLIECLHRAGHIIHDSGHTIDCEQDSGHIIHDFGHISD